jgi:hypothetical protein
MMVSETPSETAVAQREAPPKPDFSTAAWGHLFPAPLMVFIWPDGAELNEQLRPRVLEQASRSSGLNKTNAGGWHSEVGRLEFCGDAGKRLVRHMHEMAYEATQRTLAELRSKSRCTFRWVLHAWANVNGPGDFNRYHAHAGSTWSGCYYIDTGAPAEGDETPLTFFDPCQGRANTFLHPMIPSAHLVRPAPGMMVLFPSYMPHMVPPPPGRAATHLDRLQPAQGAVPMSVRLAPSLHVLSLAAQSPLLG